MKSIPSIFVAELIILTLTLVFGILWVINPNGPYEPFTYLFGVLLLLLEFVRRHQDKPSTDLNLYIPFSQKLKSLAALKYQARIVPLIGRKIEMATLHDFMKTDNTMEWWVMGGEGGTGKSRLALELCYFYKKKGWRCGFFNTANYHDLKNWLPTKSHLIICDYSLEKERDIKDLINYSIQLNNDGKLQNRIRILLIERDADQAINKMINEPIFGSTIEYFLYQKTSLLLYNPSEEDVKVVISKTASFFGLNKTFKDFLVL